MHSFSSYRANRVASLTFNVSHERHTLDLHRTAAVATIVATLIAVWQFVGAPHNSAQPPNFPPLTATLAKGTVALDLTLEAPAYKGERKWLVAMYDAARAMPYASTKSDALKKLVKASIAEKDFNMAIIAAKDSPYSSTKAEMLDDIVNAAMLSEPTVGYAVLAAENMPYSSSKAAALERIVNAYASFSKKKDAQFLPANNVLQPTTKNGG